MKKMLSFWVIIVLLIMPVLSFAESATDTHVRINVNEDILSVLVGEENSGIAAIVQAFSLVLHSQENQIRTMLNIEDYTLADIIFEMTQDGILIGSSLIDDNAILISFQDLNAFTNPDGEGSESMESLMANVNFDHTMEIIQEVVSIDFQEVDTWEGASDAAAILQSYTVSSDGVLKILDAIADDIRASGIADKLMELSNSSADFDTSVTEAKAGIAEALPADNDFITVIVGLNNDGEVVYCSADISYIEKTVADVDFKEVTNDAGEADYKLEYIYESKNANLFGEAARSFTDESQIWNCDFLRTVENDSVSAYFGLDLGIVDNDFNVILNIGSLEETAEEADITMMTHLTVNDIVTENENSGSFEFGIDMKGEDDFNNFFTLKGSPSADGGSNGYSVSLYIGGIENEFASVSINTVPSDLLSSIAGNTLIGINDLNEETLNMLKELATDHIMSLFGGLAGLAE